jgi:hypothetical protein
MNQTAVEVYEQWRRPLNLPEGGVDSISVYAETIEKWAPIRNGHNSAFRGEDKFFDTYCVPKLGRHGDHKDFQKLSDFLKRKGHIGSGTETVMLLEEFHILSKFRQWFIANNPDIVVPALHATGWIDLAQHFGAPTRLLDVSRNPLVGLFFACWSPRSVCDEEEDGIVWIKEVKGSVRQHSVPRVEYLSRLEGDAEIQQGWAESYFDFFEAWAFSRTHQDVDHLYVPLGRNMEVNRRVYAQHGQFIWNTKMGRCGQWFPILVPKVAKKRLLAELNNLYVNPFMLFPGEDGDLLQEKLNDWLDGKPVKDSPHPGFEWTWPGKDKKYYFDLIPKPKY